MFKINNNACNTVNKILEIKLKLNKINILGFTTNLSNTTILDSLSLSH
jgi:hypothetical protein